MADFNAPGFEWEQGLSLPNCHYYSRLKGGAACTCTCLLGLTQTIETDNSNQLDLVFTNFDNAGVTFADAGIGKAGIFHRHMAVDIDLTFYKFAYSSERSHCKYAAGYHCVVRNALTAYNWPEVCSNTTADAAVDSLSAAVHYATDQFVPSGFITRNKYSSWLTVSSRLYSYL
jgi:hypothetical protein